VASIDLTFSGDSPGAGTKHFRGKYDGVIYFQMDGFPNLASKLKQHLKKIRRLVSEVMEAE